MSLWVNDEKHKDGATSVSIIDWRYLIIFLVAGSRPLGTDWNSGPSNRLLTVLAAIFTMATGFPGQVLSTRSRC